ncbi:hypothetical protein QN095_02225 [Enterobacter cloacae]|uniref:hypothetical protein n=1 Tax=Enterobacter cloacae TaxID=550 RepID=UPI002540B53D|nr:hypothetical protein [Enterobacter cloacae]WIF62923.1 hypothetical protein QN095_02225 [Enterobacter cloacae]
MYDTDGRMWEPTEDLRLQPLAERLRKHDLNVFLGILGLEREKSPAPRHIAAYIISGLNNDRLVAREAMEHLKHLELFADLDSIHQALEPPIHEISKETPSTTSPPAITSSNSVVVMRTPALIKIDSQTQNRIDKLRGNITHHRDGNFILSIVRDDMFQNSYYPESWHFEINYRDKENTDYYASDVAFLQYEEVSKAEGFYGRMPQTIIRKNVINKNTNTVMDEVNKSKLPMRQPFLWHTQNGKSTMRIMDLYGMEATKVTRSNNDYIIDVKSKVSSP